MATNERTQPNDDQMPVDKPGDSPSKRAPVQEPEKRKVPEKDPPTNQRAQQAPTDPDIAKQGHVEFGESRTENRTESQATVDAANGEVPVSQVIA